MRDVRRSVGRHRFPPRAANAAATHYPSAPAALAGPHGHPYRGPALPLPLRPASSSCQHRARRRRCPPCLDLLRRRLPPRLSTSADDDDDDDGDGYDDGCLPLPARPSSSQPLVWLIVIFFLLRHRRLNRRRQLCHPGICHRHQRCQEVLLSRLVDEIEEYLLLIIKVWRLKPAAGEDKKPRLNVFVPRSS